MVLIIFYFQSLKERMRGDKVSVLRDHSFVHKIDFAKIGQSALTNAVSNKQLSSRQFRAEVLPVSDVLPANQCPVFSCPFCHILSKMI